MTTSAKEQWLRRFDDLADELRKKAAEDDLADQRPRFHYTTAEGIRGIITSGRLWATNLQFLNDGSELTYGRALVADELSRQSGTPTSVAGRLASHVTQRVLRTAEFWGGYAVCFCFNGDLLSQWRGYADEGVGYAIGFAPQAVRRARTLVKGDGYVEPPPYPVCGRVVYNETRQRTLIRDLFSQHLQLLEEAVATSTELADVLLEHAATGLFSTLINNVYFFKDPAFEEEEEWRALSVIFGPFMEKWLKFRSARGIVKPFIELELPPNKRNGWPIDRVVIGPSNHAQLAMDSLKILSRSNGLGFEIVQSKVPYRPRSNGWAA